MANFAKVEIEITGTPVLGQFVEVGFDGQPVTIKEIASTVSTVGKFQANLGSESEFLGSAIVRDYFPGGVLANYPLQEALGDIDSYVFEASEYGHIFTSLNEPSWANITITPEVEPPAELEIDTITPSEADGVDKCTKAKYSFTVNNATYPVTITSPVNKVCATPSDLFFDFDRYPVPTVNLVIIDDTLDEDTKILPRVSTYNFETSDINVLEAFSGATITLNPVRNTTDNVWLPSFLYSLDDISYQAGNVFYGILPGNYTGYVLDSFGCKKSATFEVIGVTVDKPLPIFTIQNANGLKFYKKQVFDYKTTFPNYDNALVNDQDIFNTELRCYKQPVQTNDTSETQIQTNYESVLVEVKRLYDDEVIATPAATEVKTNILKKDKRDCKIIGDGPGKTLIYFPGGNIYIPDTTTIDKQYTNPNLRLPTFLDSGTLDSGVFVTLSSNTALIGDFKVEDDFEQELSDGSLARVLQINAEYTGAVEGTDAIVQSLYNALDYNSWEFDINWAAIGEGDYYIDTNGTDVDPRYEDEFWSSEPINVKIRQDNTVYIEYSNSSNFAQMDYSTGIVNFIRVPARFALYQGAGEKETFETAEGRIIPLREIITRDITLESSLVPQYVIEKINIAAAHKDNLVINGLPVAQQEKGESESRFSDQNRFYTYNGVFRLNETTIFTNETGIVTDAGDVLGTGSGNFVLATSY